MAKELRIAWDEQVPNGTDRYVDDSTSRTLSGGPAKARKSIQANGRESVIAPDWSRTIQGGLGKAPKEGKVRIPDDNKPILPV